jgi:tRNA G18 (ribose-2'-O)-methylase SpoU
MKKTQKLIHKKFQEEWQKNKTLAQFGMHDLILILDHLKNGFNIGKILRSAEVFSIKEIHIVGTKEFDPYPAKGSFKRVKCHFFDSLESSINKLKADGYEIFVFDTHTDQYLHTLTFPKKSALLLGHEEFGPILNQNQSSELQKIKIKQFGKTESLNVSIAASIGIYEYLRQHSL